MGEISVVVAALTLAGTYHDVRSGRLGAATDIDYFYKRGNLFLQ